MIIRRFSKCVSTYIKAGEKVIHGLKNRYSASVKFNCYSQSCNNGPWSVLFFGTDEFALASLKALNHNYRQSGFLRRLEVVTAYRGQENAVIKYAKEHNIIVHNWPPRIKKDDFEIGVVVSFGHLIPSRIIDLFPLGMINVHGSLLPRWRGAAPICHALLNGDTVTGVSIMKIMPKKFDVGSVIAQRKISIHPDETYVELYRKLANLGADLLTETMTEIPDVLNTAQPQIENEATYAPKITEKISYINWKDMSATNIYNLQRALCGIEPLRTHFNKEVVKLLDVRVVSESANINCTREKVPGLAIFDKKNKKLYVSCKGNGWITVGTVVIPGRRPQSAFNFGCGFILNRKEKSCSFY
ncbi:methionyl-tRNA formyltransferase, mitochondrial [Copidosoma floridanum]|uniref:methionyl-tRNA formyltransferase, mitochondrial n=1 Tax=Copidosoma floridanum TaxID=29053 RepID=UPI0006C9717B|nr:methionyl-tRNA formyltransferase, mitochondrial [Copidosoma floridanum]